MTTLFHQTKHLVRKRMILMNKRSPLRRSTFTYSLMNPGLFDQKHLSINDKNNLLR